MQHRTLFSALAVVFFACVEALAVMPEVYQQRWSDPAVVQRIERNIEKHRKGDAVVEVVDAQGNPVADVRIELRQTGHEFLFGCNAFVLGQLKTPEENQHYEARFTQLFNFVAVPFYWEGTEPSQGELRYEEGGRDIWRRPPTDRYLQFAEKYGLTLKGHPLLWHACNPPWLPKDAEALRELYQKRFREITSRYSEKIPIWDVVNESLVAPESYPLYTPDRSYVAWAFREAAPLFPATTTLMINEVNFSNFGTAATNRYFAQVKSLLADGVPIRGIGFQFHLFGRKQCDDFLVDPNCQPKQLLDLYEAFGEFGLPLFITEITIPSAGAEGEALQAELARDYYRLWFSVPAMRGITWWNLGDATAYKQGSHDENDARGGLVDEALQPKASYRALDELINHAWKTNATARTDAAGRAAFRGFFGKYQVTLTRGDKTRQVEINHAQSGEKLHRVSLDE